MSELRVFGVTGIGEIRPRDDLAGIIATSLAADAPRRTALRSTLRSRLLNSPLCDGKAFADRFGAALRMMWRDWCSHRTDPR